MARRHFFAPLRTERLETRVLLAAHSSRPHASDSLPDLSEVEYRSIDGSGNNLIDDTQGAAGTNVIRFGYPAVYDDGHGDAIDVAGRPNARDISNAVHAQSESVVNDRHLTDWIFQWGQFLTHDMDLTGNGSEFNVTSTGEVGDFSIPITDPNDPLGPVPIPFNRSEFDPTTGTPDLIDAGFGPRPNWREQVNEITSYIDASNVYGSDDERAAELRTFEGGKLITTADGQLPGLNENGLPNDDPVGLGTELFLAGDVRANEHIGLTATHSLFVREHNRLADRIHELDPSLDDEAIYQLARRIVSAEIQAITYNEFLPALLGPEAAPSAEAAEYSEEVDASITNSFAAAIFRFGHSMINEELLLVDNDGQTVERVSLSEAFFSPDLLKENPESVDLILKGLASQLGQENDLLLVDGIRNSLFGPPGAGGLDLAALDIERGRDHGLPDYNSLREFYGLERVTSFEEISSDPAIQDKLFELYGSIDNIDAFVGALAEDHLPGSSVGALVNAVTVNQFTRLRDGDRFFYTNDTLLSSRFVEQIVDLDEVTLAEVIRNNTEITEIQNNVFFDSSVIYHRAEGGRHSSVTVQADGDKVKLINDSTGRVIDQGSLDEISQVILVGDDTARNRFTVDVARAGGGLEEGVIVVGGGSTRDELRVLGSRRSDTIVVDGSDVNVNGNAIEQTGFERLEVQTGKGRDDVDVVDEGDVDVEVFEGDWWYHDDSKHRSTWDSHDDSTSRNDRRGRSSGRR